MRDYWVPITLGGILSLGIIAILAVEPQSAAQPAAKAADIKNYTETIPETTVKFDMIAIPGGTFQMGSPAAKKTRGRSSR